MNDLKHLHTLTDEELAAYAHTKLLSPLAQELLYRLEHRPQQTRTHKNRGYRAPAGLL